MHADEAAERRGAVERQWPCGSGPLAAVQRTPMHNAESQDVDDVKKQRPSALTPSRARLTKQRPMPTTGTPAFSGQLPYQASRKPPAVRAMAHVQGQGAAPSVLLRGTLAYRHLDAAQDAARDVQAACLEDGPTLRKRGTARACERVCYFWSARTAKQDIARSRPPSGWMTAALSDNAGRQRRRLVQDKCRRAHAR
jgi:hypothetical protein